MNEKKYLIQYTTRQGYTSQFYIKAKSEQVAFDDLMKDGWID